MNNWKTLAGQPTILKRFNETSQSLEYAFQQFSPFTGESTITKAKSFTHAREMRFNHRAKKRANNRRMPINKATCKLFGIILDKK